MSISVVMDGDLLRVRLTDAVTREDLFALVTVVADLERGRDVVPHRITDMRNIRDLQIAYPDVQELADDRKARQFPNPLKSAIVVGSSAQMGMARMFRTINDNPQISIEIFEDEAAALRWLRE